MTSGTMELVVQGSQSQGESSSSVAATSSGRTWKRQRSRSHPPHPGAQDKAAATASTAEVVSLALRRRPLRSWSEHHAFFPDAVYPSFSWLKEGNYSVSPNPSKPGSFLLHVFKKRGHVFHWKSTPLCKGAQRKDYGAKGALATLVRNREHLLWAPKFFRVTPNEKVEALAQKLIQEWKDLGISRGRTPITVANGVHVDVRLTIEEIIMLASSGETFAKVFGATRTAVLRGGYRIGSPSVQRYVETKREIVPFSITEEKELLLLVASLARLVIPRPTPRKWVTGRSAAQFLAETFQDSQGLIVGEHHREAAPKKLLIDQMAELYRIGVRTLFLEGLLRGGLQHDLDFYYLRRSGEMPPLLKKSLAACDKRWGFGEDAKYGYTALVKAAMENQIRVVGFETDASASFCNVKPPADSAGMNPRQNASDSSSACGMPSSISPDEEIWLGIKHRLLAMNYVAEQVIRHEQKIAADLFGLSPSHRWIVLTGQRHVTKAFNILGLSERLNARNVVVYNEPTDLSTDPAAPLYIYSAPDGEYRGEKGAQVHNIVSFKDLSQHER